MKSLRIMISVIVAFGALVALASPAGAQRYEGASLEEGILFIPADLGPGSTVDFSVAGLAPNSELTITLVNADGTAVDGVSVQGAVVVRADAQGNFNGDIALPASLDGGVFSLQVVGTMADGSPYSNSFSLNVSQDGVGGTNDALALTGASSSSTAMNGVLIIALGVVMVAIASRRRTVETVTEGV